MVSQMQGLWIRIDAETQLAFEVDVLEILKRAKSGGEIVAWNESEANVKEEVLRRNAKAGYCRGATKIMDRGFGESKLNIWPRDDKGNLIGD
ncbi:MAG: hypothetical protein KAV00_10305 [Phycisphaerae bacterium]|nr:hypothetical protein [Phycisphaerae bacterium]